jgi:hypothetical protein
MIVPIEAPCISNNKGGRWLLTSNELPGAHANDDPVSDLVLLAQE